MGYYEEKNLLGLFLLCSIALAGCSSPSDSDDRTETQMEPQENAETQPRSKQFCFGKNQKISSVAYFSWADNAVLDDDVDAVSSHQCDPTGKRSAAGGLGAGGNRGRSVFHPGDRSISQRLG